MARQGYREISIEVPDDWEDRTVLAFAAPPRPGKASQPNVVVTREPLPKGQNVRTFAAKQMTASARGLPGFELEASRDRMIGGVPAVELVFTWEGDNGPVAQRQLVLAVDQTAFTVTASAARGEMAAVESTFEAILGSLVFGAPSPVPVRPSQAMPVAHPAPPGALPPPPGMSSPFGPPPPAPSRAPAPAPASPASIPPVPPPAFRKNPF